MGSWDDLWALDRARESEAMRMVLRRELRHTPQRLLAALIGISRSSLRKFLALSDPGEPTRERIRHWCEDRPPPDLPLGAVALSMLAAGLPAPHRLGARRALAARLAELYEEVGAPVPGWVEEGVQVER